MAKAISTCLGSTHRRYAPDKVHTVLHRRAVTEICREARMLLSKRAGEAAHRYDKDMVHLVHLIIGDTISFPITATEPLPRKSTGLFSVDW